MIIQCSKSILNNAITPALLAVTNKNTIPALEGLLIVADEESGSLTICGYDLEKGVRVVISGENVTIKESGSVIINAAKFSSIIRNLSDGDIEIESDKNFIVSIKSNKSEFNLHSIDGESFPNLPVLKGEKNFKMKQENLKDLIGRTLFSVAVNNPKPVLNGVYFEINDKLIKAVSVDGQRFSYRVEKEGVYIKDGLAHDGSIIQKFVVPAKTLSELFKLLKDSEDFAEIEMTSKHLIVKIDNIIFFSRLIEGEYIDYAKTVPGTASTVCRINKREFIESVERASVIMDERNKDGVIMNFEYNEGDSVLKISSVNSIGKVNDEFSVEMDGESVRIKLNPTYILDALRHIEDEFIMLKIESGLRPVIILPEEDYNAEKNNLDYKYLYLIVPMRIRD